MSNNSNRTANVASLSANAVIVTIIVVVNNNSSRK